MTRQMEALLLIANHPLMAPIMRPHIDIEHESVNFKAMSEGRSGGEKAVLAWAWVIWTDEQVPTDHEGFKFHLRDPFQGFTVMGAELQALCLTAFAYRHEVKYLSPEVLA